MQVRTDTSVTLCYVRRGRIHGLARRVEMKKFREFRQQLTFVGRYHSGRAVGPTWRYKEGGGYLFCPDTSAICEGVRGIGDEGFSGDKVAYIYPDLETAIIGTYKDGVLVTGEHT